MRKQRSTLKQLTVYKFNFMKIIEFLVWLKLMIYFMLRKRINVYNLCINITIWHIIYYIICYLKCFILSESQNQIKYQTLACKYWKIFVKHERIFTIKNLLVLCSSNFFTRRLVFVLSTYLKTINLNYPSNKSFNYTYLPTSYPM